MATALLGAYVQIKISLYFADWRLRQSQSITFFEMHGLFYQQLHLKKNDISDAGISDTKIDQVNNLSTQSIQYM